MNGVELGLEQEQCEKFQKVLSKFGETLVCNEEDEAKENADLVMPNDETCQNMKKVASKVGYTVVCDENN